MSSRKLFIAAPIALLAALLPLAAQKATNPGFSKHEKMAYADQNLANYVQSQTRKHIISWDGNCYVHHQITPAEVERAKAGIPGLVVIAHPECRKDVIAMADAVLSTSAMMRYARESSADKFLIVTECGLSDRLLMEIPEKHFYKACKLCRYMKMITLPGVRDSLINLRYEITMGDEVREGARRALERMLELGS